MNKKATYHTRQREQILRYLKSVPGVHTTAGDLCRYFEEQGTPIGKATVYRHLERLVDEGLVNKYHIDSESSACFEFCGETAHCEHDVCFHCKCEKCGRLIHLHCTELEQVQKHLKEQHQFLLDPLRVVFYGVCEECKS